MTPAERSPRVYEPDADTATAPGEDEVERLTARVAALEVEKAVLEADNAALESFAAVAAHELVVPLIMTESYTGIVSDRLAETDHADSREDLARLGRSAARTRRLVETLLHDARSSGRPLRVEPVDLDAIVDECVGLMRPEIDERGAEVESAELPVVAGEQVLLSALFTNLIYNALKYSPRRGGKIRIGASRESAEWRFLVESEGPTIPLEDRERIFEPFHRARTERRERGAGLGLTICRRIVERHGGTIGVTAANGSGNRFFFTLPAG
jgi:chemotaxis family two-component system sensor kinase Cph1